MALLDDFQATGGDEIVSATGKESMRKTKGWIAFIAILGIIITGIYTLISIISIAREPISGLFASIISGFFLFASISLLLYKNKIDRFLVSGNIYDFESGLISLKRYFIIWGVLLIFYAVLVVVFSLSFLLYFGKIMTQVGNYGGY